MKNLVKIAKLSLAVASILSVVSTSTLAEDLANKSKEEWAGKKILPFIAYDKDQDRFVSKSEFYTTNSERTSERDTQNMPFMHASNGPDFREYDTDLDGKLNETEFLKSCNHCHESR